jgi:hypothetical protein
MERGWGEVYPSADNSLTDVALIHDTVCLLTRGGIVPHGITPHP